MQIESILMETLCEKIKNLEIYSDKSALKIYFYLALWLKKSSLLFLSKRRGSIDPGFQWSVCFGERGSGWLVFPVDGESNIPPGKKKTYCLKKKAQINCMDEVPLKKHF
jgi:hypothetical protein